MNREIKFRFWDGEEMYYQDSNTASAMDGLVLFAIKAGNVRGRTPDIMQFTGLKDASGKQVYAGDVFDNSDIVIFCDQCAGWQFAYMFYEDVRCHNCDGNYSFQECIEDGVVSKDMVGIIAGNIHENPELLK